MRISNELRELRPIKAGSFLILTDGENMYLPFAEFKDEPIHSIKLQQVDLSLIAKIKVK